MVGISITGNLVSWETNKMLILISMAPLSPKRWHLLILANLIWSKKFRKLIQSALRIILRRRSLLTFKDNIQLRSLKIIPSQFSISYRPKKILMDFLRIIISLPFYGLRWLTGWLKSYRAIKCLKNHFLEV